MAKKKLNPEDFTRFTTPVPVTPGGSGLVDRSRFASAAPQDRAGEMDEESGSVVGEYPLAQILPDPFQGRGGLLPLKLQIPVYNGKLSPAEALSTWVEDVTSEEEQASLYYTRYQDLRDLANSIHEQGLINPIHIYRPAGQFGVYRLESGERRYWAYWLLELEHPGEYSRVRAILEDGFSLGRQIDENEDVSALSPVGQARNVARVYLSTLGVEPLATLQAGKEVTAEALYAYFHQAAQPVSDLIGQNRLPDGFWETLEKLIKKNRVSILERLAVFSLPRPALELADAGNLNFHQLKEVLSAKKDEIRAELVKLAVGFDLTGADLGKLAALAESDPGAYTKAVQEIKSNRSAVPEVTARRKQGSPVEVLSKRMFQAVRSLERMSDGETRALAEKIRRDRPKDVEAMIGVLEDFLRVLKANR